MVVDSSFFGTDRSLLESRELRLFCFLRRFILRMRSARLSLYWMTNSSGISFEVDEDDVDDDGRRKVTVSSNSFKSNVVVCLLGGI